MRRHLGLVLAVGLLVTASPARSEEKNDAGKIEGNWSIVAMTMSGAELPTDDLKQVTITLKGDRYTVKFGDEVIDEGTFKVDASKKPTTMDATSTKGENKGKTRLGIYELKGEDFKAIFAEPGKDRPTDMTTKKGDEKTLYVMKRATK